MKCLKMLLIVGLLILTVAVQAKRKRGNGVGNGDDDVTIAYKKKDGKRLFSGTASGFNATCTATGDFNSFDRWNFKIEGSKLRDSNTDQFSNEGFSTSLLIEGSTATLTQTTYASDAILQYGLSVDKDSHTGDVMVRAYQTYIDTKGDSDQPFTEVVKVTLNCKNLDVF